MTTQPTSTRGVQNRQPIVNDFTINVATANGTGSQTSNIALARAMFRMGIAVCPKNLFPSNIQGLPTWYRLRVNDNGYTAFRDTFEILIAMNKATVDEDVATVASGGVIFYDDSLKMPEKRDDVTYYAMPVKTLVREQKVPPQLRTYIANMVYVGAACELLGIELEEIRKALFTHFKGKEKAVEINMKMIEAAAEWTRQNLTKEDPFRIERRDGNNEGKIFVEGNTAGALGAIYGGVNVVSWYPITPATSLADSLNEYLPKLRKDKETGKNTFAIMQAEDELSAIGGVIGAGWVGARALTSTAGPGISLMAEFAGLAYFAEIPSVIWDIQRVGPSTGLPTRTSQGDVLFAYYLGHGDTRHVILLPSSPAECFEFGYKSLDLADQLQTLVFVLSDLDLGMNLWMSEPFEYPSEPIKHGKVLTKEQLQELGTKWGRFVDADGDGVGYRTIPGTEHPLAGYFTRGTGHNEMATYSERGDDWEANYARIRRKFETARNLVPAPEVHKRDGATFGIISYGSNHPSLLEATAKLAAEGHNADYMRLKALPINDEVRQFIEAYDQVFVVENNFEGQVHQILQHEMPHRATNLISAARCNGLPLTPPWLMETFKSQLK